MTTEQNKETFRRIFNIINSGELSGLDELLAEDFTYRSASGEEARGRENAKEFISSYHQAFDGFELSFEDLIAEGDKVAYVYSQTGTQVGEFFGVSPNHADMDIDIMGITTFEDGKAVGAYEIFDTLQLMQQLGASPDEIGLGGRESMGGQPRAGA
jgi:steroid delta-isomerase-like uncharacterized protein